MEHLNLAIALIGSVPVLAIVQGGFSNYRRTRRMEAERRRLEQRLAARAAC